MLFVDIPILSFVVYRDKKQVDKLSAVKNRSIIWRQIQGTIKIFLLFFRNFKHVYAQAFPILIFYVHFSICSDTQLCLTTVLCKILQYIILSCLKYEKYLSFMHLSFIVFIAVNNGSTKNFPGKKQVDKIGYSTSRKKIYSCLK